MLKNSANVISNPSQIILIVSSLGFLLLPYKMLFTEEGGNAQIVANLFIDIFLSLHNSKILFFTAVTVFTVITKIIMLQNLAKSRRRVIPLDYTSPNGVIFMTVTFFGHRFVPNEIKPILKNCIVDLIEHYNADLFYVGNHGGFDYMVSQTLKELKKTYPYISYSVVLSYMPKVSNELDNNDFSNTLYPEGLENVPKKYAICKRNRWLVEHSNIVIAYVTCSFGGAAQFVELARKKGKQIINLAD